MLRYLVRRFGDRGGLEVDLADLDPDERDVLMMREYDVLSYDEMAAALGVPVGTVRSRLFRAREAMRHQLAGRPARGVSR